MVYIYSNDDLHERWYALQGDGDPRLTCYLYRMVDNQKSKPAQYKGRFHDRFEKFVQDKIGPGKFYVMVRRGEIMEIAGIIDIGLPRSHPRYQEYQRAGWVR
jgi:hypothetical protein